MILSALEEIACSASDLILSVDQGAYKTEKKEDGSYVTAADRKADGWIQQALKTLTPSIPYVSEETYDPLRDTRRMGEEKRYWLVDPLDGTMDFISGSDHFTVNIDLISHFEPVIGCVYWPRGKVGWIGQKGVGAFEFRQGACKRPIRTRKLDSIDKSAFVISRFHGKGYAEWIRKIAPHGTCDPMGSSLKYMQIAKGSADVSVRRKPISVWDIAASDCILREAGGGFYGEKGALLDYRDKKETPPFIALGDPSHLGEWLRYWTAST